MTLYYLTLRKKVFEAEEAGKSQRETLSKTLRIMIIQERARLRQEK